MYTCILRGFLLSLFIRISSMIILTLSIFVANGTAVCWSTNFQRWFPLSVGLIPGEIRRRRSPTLLDDQSTSSPHVLRGWNPKSSTQPIHGIAFPGKFIPLFEGEQRPCCRWASSYFQVLRPAPLMKPLSDCPGQQLGAGIHQDTFFF